jgi:hypothetical protein
LAFTDELSAQSEYPGTYYPTEATKVAAVIYSESVTGLRTTRAGTGPTATGIIAVGRDFIDNTTETFFARRVLQVGHELQHIDQYRAGMIGANNKAKREFLPILTRWLRKARHRLRKKATRLATIDALWLTAIA